MIGHPSFCGVSIIQSEYMTETKSRVVRRSWRERILSWPWRPWRKMCVVYHEEPLPYLMRVRDDLLICHPTVYRQLVQELND